MKAVLIPIQPLDCELIAKGKKRVIVTKRKTTLETPFKGYLYETKDKRYENIGVYWVGGQKFIHHIGNIIGEFVCDCIDKLTPDYNPIRKQYFYNNDWENHDWNSDDYCLTDTELLAYGKGKTLYGWHISKLKIYDIPKDVCEFTVAQHEYIGKRVYRSYGGWKVKRVTNWCYVEEIEE